jgi:anaerobic selenocysteine-containing dehydrogenase
MAEKLGFAWDTSDYLAIPAWQPGPAQESMKLSPEYDLYCLNYKTPLHTFSHTAENPWLNEFSEYNPYIYKIMINTETAKARGIKNGDVICVESKVGKVEGVAKVTECISPEAIAIAGTLGSWAKGKPIAKGKGVHHNALLPYAADRMGGVDCATDDKPEVKVYKKET